MDVTSNNLAYGASLISQLNNQTDSTGTKGNSNISGDINFANLMHAIGQGNADQMGAIQALADLGNGSSENFQSGDNLSNMFGSGNMSATTMQGLLDLQSQNMFSDAGIAPPPPNEASQSKSDYTSTATKSRSETVDSILEKLEEMEASQSSTDTEHIEGHGQELFMAIDSDGDGKLSQQELSDFGPAIRNSFGGTTEEDV
ncbi:hypothetical protein [Curvivirga sp.]|uniref:hypothetical protein n=1 Tax=Curvivirga sp. TaxID=2856848 RepID=UPI003B5A790E